MKITSHKELADYIAGKRILHLNSLGKDSVICLEWLARYARPSAIYSIYFNFLAEHPGDKPYWKYLQQRYPHVIFLSRPNSVELSLMTDGCYQTPLEAMEFNRFEHEEFYREKMTQELKEELACDLICVGASKYESFARRVKFYQKGLLFKDEIFPIGLMTKQEVIGAIKDCGMKLHPIYKYASSTPDHPSYWKMRNLFVSSPEYEEKVMQAYPLLALDKYRYERML